MSIWYVCLIYLIIFSHSRCFYTEVSDMGWLRLVGSLKPYVSFAEYSLFYRALLQKRRTILRSLRIVATPLIWGHAHHLAFHQHWIMSILIKFSRTSREFLRYSLQAFDIIEWFWLRDWLIHKGANCTGTASSVGAACCAHWRRMGGVE